MALKGFGISTLAKQSLRLINIDFESVETETGIAISPYKYGYPSASCISIDFEHKLDYPGNDSMNSRGTKAILELAEEFEIPLTWAICGETAEKERDTYDLILKSKVNHEIGAHTYSHLDVTGTNQTEYNVRDDILKGLEVINTVERPMSFVFPYNREGHFGVLRRLGFIAYRSKKRVLGYPKKMHGLWCIPPLYYIDDATGDFDTARRFIDLAISFGCVFHMWFHPRSIAIAGDIEGYVENILKPIFQYISDKRLEGKLWNCTMGELANYCEAREKVTIKLESKEALSQLAVGCTIKDPRFDYPPQVTIQIPIIHSGTTVIVNGGKITNTKVSELNQELYLFIPLTFEEPIKHIGIIPPAIVTTTS